MSKCYIVGTPIGNLGDITLRALETLRSVDVIASEDTRHTAILLNKYGIKKPLISYYKQKEREGADEICALINSGKSVALVTDAGMPCVSDPGAVLVRVLSERNVPCEIVPGASAVTSAVALAGLYGNGFTFLGFLPDKKKDCDELLMRAKSAACPLVVFSAPHDLPKRLSYLYEKLGARRVAVVKEMTKIHETVYRGRLGSVNIDDPRGEFVIVVDEPDESSETFADTPEEAVLKLIAAGMPKNEALKTVAAERGIKKSDLYRLFVND